MSTTYSTYAAYMQAVDKILLRRYGLTHDDFEDYCWRSCYDWGDSPSHAIICFREEILGEDVL